MRTNIALAFPHSKSRKANPCDSVQCIRLYRDQEFQFHTECLLLW